MKRFSFLYLLLITYYFSPAQTPKTYTSSEILLQLKKLNVLGSVLYIAAHPDDENTRLLAYLANEKMYRTGYLSLTRGDGGQNLIGDEQGIDLGLIRTQELLAARRIDGAEQFFSRAYDFGFCKSPEEALATWGHDKILSDVVWVIRKFKPDVIIARFPEDSRAGHGHHAASGILAREAFDAAADSTKFPEQLTKGVTIWQAKRMLWNTFSFGSTNTTNESQFKVDVGMYNPLLGKSYGEIAALSRSQHKSQGFGVPAQRGSVIEYFETIKGEKPVSDLMEGVDVSWNRENKKNIEDSIAAIISRYDLQNPVGSLKDLLAIYNTNNQQQIYRSYWAEQKLSELRSVIENCSGLFIEAVANTQYATQGDSITITVSVNNRLGLDSVFVGALFFNNQFKIDSLKRNTTVSKAMPVFIIRDMKLSQPYWLENPMSKGSFNITDQSLIGKAEYDRLIIEFKISINNVSFWIGKPLRYKFTDPVKGEIYQPVFVVPPVTLHVTPELNVFVPGNKNAFTTKTYHLFTDGNKLDSGINDYVTLAKLSKGLKTSVTTAFDIASNEKSKTFDDEHIEMPVENGKGKAYSDIKEIDYDHIPSIKYFKETKQRILVSNVKIAGKRIGYIIGAGDKVPQALEQMGYKVTTLKESDITLSNLKQFDAVITGIRAYNTNDWMSNVYDALMQYVNDGGVLLTQYNTSNFISNVKSKIGPYPFSISRNRVTDENAKVNFLLPNHPALNYPNKITEKDFEGWIQERSIYHAEKIDSNYQRIISMHDAGEKDDDGSLIIANYGKGKFVYTGVVFFRELPAGVPGAYRLFANLIAPPQMSGKSNAKQKSLVNKTASKPTLSGKSIHQ
jgi:LmbE family N-acetylglucosaminyl deacetylase